MKLAIYCRVSTAAQSCERQERDLLAYAQRAGYEVVVVWKETDSGVKLNLRVRSQVIALAQDFQIDAVLVTELTRWGRSTLDLIPTLQDLQSDKNTVNAIVKRHWHSLEDASPLE